MDDKDKLVEIIRHLRIIRDRTIDLDNYLGTLNSTIKDNLSVDGDGYKSSTIDYVDSKISNVTSSLRDDVIPSLVRRANSK